VDLLADSDQFPEDWLFKHRWSKGKKNQSSALPNGNKIVFITVGGRTSAVVPAVQKKTGPVAKDIPDKDVEGGEEANETSNGKRKRGAIKKEDNPEDDDTIGRKRTASKRNGTSDAKSATKKEKPAPSQSQSTGRRRSTRNAK